MTDSLFLSLRDKEELARDEKRKRRQILEILESSLAEELLAEFQRLRSEDDAASSTSNISVTGFYHIGENGEEVEHYLVRGQPATGSDLRCGEDCFVRNWEVDESTIASHEDEPQGNNESSETPFLYEALPDHYIRVLELEPESTGIPLACTLHILDLHSVPDYKRFADIEGELRKYEALSYCWGAPERTCSIICNNEVVKVTRNLFLALQHLRQPDRPRYLWVDAICINQSDNSERSSQVRMMLEIYKRAFQVVIWLGPDTSEEGGLAVNFLEMLDDDFLRFLILEPQHSFECLVNLKRAYTAVFKLFERPWFRRTWIRQELAAGRKVVVQCGLKAIPWSQFKRSSKRIARLYEKLQQSTHFPDLPNPNDETLVQNITYLKRGWKYGQTAIGFVSIPGSLYYWHGGGLLDLLLIGGKFEATDPRDKVYAVLGLAREPILGGENDHALYPYIDENETFEEMVVNYDHSISQVYQRLAKHFINRDLNLDILCILGTYPIDPCSDVPSWAPDWRFPWNQSLWDYLQFKFFASGTIRAKRQDQADLGKVQVEVYLVDQVVELLDVTSNAWKLLYENGEEIIRSNGAKANETAWRKLPVFEKFNPANRKRCCLTRLGHVALVPPEAIKGDFIFVVLGARLPFVLRGTGTLVPPLEVDRGECHMKCDFREARVVGPCCLPGFMLGEIFSDMEGRELLDLTLV